MDTPLFREFLCKSLRAVTAETYLKRLRILAGLADLDNVERVKALICTYQASEAFKELLANAYDYYVRFKGLTWVKPHFTREDKPFFLPTEAELDMLICHARFKMSVFLELLKETGMDAGEAWKLRWIDVDAERGTVAVSPTKNHNARTLRVSARLIGRLLRLPRRNERVFACKSLDDFRRRYEDMRRKLAVKLDNPRLNAVAFKSFRHWKATREYARTKDILYVKWLLGHKRIENTLVYTHLVDLGEGEQSYVCKTARSVGEAQALIEQGFDYVTEVDGVKLFRKLR